MHPYFSDWPCSEFLTTTTASEVNYSTKSVEIWVGNAVEIEAANNLLQLREVKNWVNFGREGKLKFVSLLVNPFNDLVRTKMLSCLVFKSSLAESLLFI